MGVGAFFWVEGEARGVNFPKVFESSAKEQKSNEWNRYIQIPYSTHDTKWKKWHKATA